MKYLIKRSEWNEIASAHLQAAIVNDPFVALSDISDLVKDGSYALYDVLDEELTQIASFVIRIDESPKVSELVIVLAAGNSPKGQSLYELITPFVEKLAKTAGCKYLRAHTKRLGVSRLMEKAGYKQDEYICRLEVA